MQLTEKETTVIKDLQTQERLCVEKYRFYEESANDPELKQLFHKIGDDEQEHFDFLGRLLKGDVPDIPEEYDEAKNYKPCSTYNTGDNSDAKRHDQFLCTDSIGTEKLVSSTYNSDLFQFAASGVRKLLNHIQTQEQNHAEMIYKYKTANAMA